MASFFPFPAILPNAGIAEQVVTLPFDAYSSQQKNKILDSNPSSFLHVILAKHQEMDSRRETLESFLMNGILQKSKTPVFLVYRQIKESARFTGFIGLLPLGTDSDYNSIKKHEATLVQKEEVLADYLDQTNLNAEPALLTFNATTQSQELILALTQPQPDFDISIPDFARHQLWVVKNPAILLQIQELFSQLPNLYIADGHHRISSSRRLALQRFQQHQNARAADQFVLSACFPSTEAQILPYHRLVKKVPADFLERAKAHLGHKCSIEPTEFARPNSAFWLLRLFDTWFKLSFQFPLPDSVLPADWLNEHILSPILKMDNLSSDKNIAFVGGNLNETDLINAQRSAAAEAIFVLPPVQFHQFFSIVNQGRLMPPKSTWFEPKLLSGFTMFDLTDQLFV